MDFAEDRHFVLDTLQSGKDLGKKNKVAQPRWWENMTLCMAFLSYILEQQTRTISTELQILYC